MRPSSVHIDIQFKMVRRYEHALLIGMISYAFFAGTISLLSQKLARYHLYSSLNIPLLGVAVGCYVLGLLFSDIFHGNISEKYCYALAPWTLRKIIVTKYSTLTLIMLLYAFPIWIGGPFIIHAPFRDYLNSGIYLLTCLPVFLILGNLCSFSRTTWESPYGSSNRLFLQLLMVNLSPVPYLILKLWLNSIPLCVAFFMLTVILWYYRVLPQSERKFMELIPKINQNEI